MKKRWLYLVAAAVLCAAMAGCMKEDGQTSAPTELVTEAVTEAPTEPKTAAEPIVVEDVERETAPDGTEYVTSLIETTYPDGTVTVESRSEIFYPDEVVYCESQLTAYYTDGTKTVMINTTRTDAGGALTVLESELLKYDSAGRLIEE